MTPTHTSTPIDRSVLAMSAARARSFFLKPESYFRIDLPPYFDFSRVLRSVAKHLAQHPLVDAHKARRCAAVNHTLYSNKDGRYAWRPFQVIHPVLYVDLAHIVTAPDAWAHITARFQDFARDSRIRCLSIPVASLTKRKDQAAQILRWWEGIEQASIDLALDFEAVLHADIADCYPSVYTHAVAWALHGKDVAKQKKRSDKLLGNLVDRRLQDMSFGQTNGIPQGSVLLDLVAEMVLGYADLEMSRRLKDAQLGCFQILRYRDDYRVFVNDTATGEAVLRLLTEVLMSLGLKLNAAKTTGFQTVIGASLKADKWAWIRARQADSSLQKHLLLIHAHGAAFPNAGSVVAALDAFYRRLSGKRSIPDARQLISIAVDIGYNSPRCFPVCAGIVSKLLSMLPSAHEKLDALSRIRRKLRRLPNNGHLEVWLQRISFPFDPTVAYTERLCTLVAGERAPVWESSWISDPVLRNIVDSANVVNRTRLKTLRAIVPRVEFTSFATY